MFSVSNQKDELTQFFEKNTDEKEKRKLSNIPPPETANSTYIQPEVNQKYSAGQRSLKNMHWIIFKDNKIKNNNIDH